MTSQIQYQSIPNINSISFQSKRKKKLKLGVVANEFFDLSTSRMGGFGWATRQVATCFNTNSELGVEVVFLAGELYETSGQSERLIHGSRLILRQRNRLAYCQKLWAEKFDCLLAIDYRPSYRSILWALPLTPILVWVRDPRPPEDVDKINTLKIPGAENIRPKGIDPIDCTSLAQVVQGSKWLGRPLLFATTASFLDAKVPGTYGVKPPKVHFLPNIIDLEPGQIKKSDRPTVVFLARLDPYKRPWIFTELAHHFPEVEFIFLGKAHFKGKGAWEPEDLPSNIKFMGHVDGDEKNQLLSSAWALINTSIHEGLAVSFLEALVCETPILSCQDPETVVSRFGIYTGRWDGSGMEGLPAFIDGLNQLLNDPELRTRLGKAGREWVEQTHSQARFLAAFQDLCSKVGALNTTNSSQRSS
jgi:glycosyltransferase involved in cell wall biosynthesis